MSDISEFAILIIQKIDEFGIHILDTLSEFAIKIISGIKKVLKIYVVKKTLGLKYLKTRLLPYLDFKRLEIIFNKK